MALDPNFLPDFNDPALTEEDKAALTQLAKTLVSGGTGVDALTTFLSTVRDPVGGPDAARRVLANAAAVLDTIAAASSDSLSGQCSLAAIIVRTIRSAV